MGLSGGIAGTAIGINEWIGGSRDKKAAKRDADNALANRPVFEESQAIKDNLSQSQLEANAYDPAVEAARRSAQMGLGGALGQGQRLASSGAQALAFGALAQANNNDMEPKLVQAEQEARQRKLMMLSDAQKAMGQQQNMKFYDKLGANADRFNYALGNLGAANARRGQGIGMFVGGLNATEEGALDLAATIGTGGMNKVAGAAKKGGGVNSAGSPNYSFGSGMA